MEDIYGAPVKPPGSQLGQFPAAKAALPGTKRVIALTPTLTLQRVLLSPVRVLQHPHCRVGPRHTFRMRSGGVVLLWSAYPDHTESFAPSVVVLDRGYDAKDVYAEVEGRNMRPVIPLRETPAVKAGKHKPPSCEHGEWTFAGSDAKRGASKWRCPTGECQPASVWVKADRLHTLIPRSTPRWKGLYHSAMPGHGKPTRESQIRAVRGLPSRLRGQTAGR